MDALKRGFLKLISSFEINVIEDYPRVRRAQEIFQTIGAKRFDYVDWEVERDDGDSIPIRIFPYEEDDREEGIILYFHGGGWATGSIDTYTRICGQIARAYRRNVCSVDYRLAPEHPFPAGLDDCYTVAERLFCHREALGIAAEDIVLCGDSAGANLAAAVALRSRDEGRFLVKRQILFYPTFISDYWSDASLERYPSLVAYSEGYGLSTQRIRDYMDLYVPDPADRQHAYVAPMLAEDWSDLPETLLITAEFDPLRDEGEAYGQRLRAEGGRVKIVRIEEAIHGFLSLPAITKPVQQAIALMEEYLDHGVTGPDEIEGEGALEGAAREA